MPIKILVVDDHELIRRRIVELLSAKPEFDIVGMAGNGLEAIKTAKQCQPDVVLMDISMPELNGIQAAPLVKKAAPQAEILMVTTHDDASFVREAFSAGARGFLMKSELPSELVPAVNDVFSKKRFISKKLMGAAGEVL